MWLLLLGKVQTLENLNARGMQLAPFCCLCVGSEESMGHLFLHCCFVDSVWESVLSPLNGQRPNLFNFLTVESFLHAWPRVQGSVFVQKVWELVPYVVIWSVWCARNDVIFKGKRRNAEQVRRETMAYLWNWLAVDEERGDHHFSDLILGWEAMVQGIG
ncbi:hypothetical protein FRX31_002767 [Thalictrum thalictroides]|uniref:Reverse transcriptase zinc-binding domain-containing protein n=1 Tax=Thalictrum thalictroides TaxID=46969 RepID=A0A7J6XCW8_THATH|nr:hypothetical protein FRX31_002767 [Thalictrum thalictroides]